MINVADLIDPKDPQRRSYRQVNAEIQHTIPVGTLVEVISTGIRLFVVYHGRDCDQTPLYWISPDKDDTVQGNTIFANRGWIGGYMESSLRVLLPDCSRHHICEEVK